MNSKLYLGDCTKIMKQIKSESIDAIVTNPPYQYIKNRDFDTPFDEDTLFVEAKRILKPSGFIVMFGRGSAFYRWNTLLDELGFVFKEEVIWDKRRTTSPCHPLSRVHETISIYAKKTGRIKRVKIPYIEQKQFCLESIVSDIRRIKSTISNPNGLDAIEKYLTTGDLYTSPRKSNHTVSLKSGTNASNRGVATLRSLSVGSNERDIIRGRECVSGPRYLRDAPRPIKIYSAIKTGMLEKSIVSLPDKHYGLSHPTQKPVRLIERLIALVSDPGDTILDPFMGSGTTDIAALNTERRFIGIEKEQNYFDIAQARINEGPSDYV
jgi:site-specific DNA-methyltransferase (adenine-specific)